MHDWWRAGVWVLGGALFGALLSWVIGNTPIGIIVGAAVGAAAGLLARCLQRRDV